MRIGARIRDFRANVRGVLEVFEGTVWNSQQWAAVDVFADWCVSTPFTGFHTFQIRLSAKHMTGIAMIFDGRMYIVIVADDK